MRMEYEVSIRINLPTEISEVLRKEKERFVAEYGSSYKSEPHITLYLDRYTEAGFPKLLHDLRELPLQPFTITLLPPQARREENRHRSLYIMDVSGKEQLRELHETISARAIPYRSPFLRTKARKRLEQQGIQTDGTRESLQVHGTPNESFDAHITLGEVGFDGPQPSLEDIRATLRSLEGRAIEVSEISVSFYGKAEGDETFKLIERVQVPF